MSYQTSSKRLRLFWLLIGARKLVFFWHQSDGRNPGDSLKFNDQYQRHQQYHRQLKHPYWAIAFNFHTSPLHLRNHGIIQELVTKIEVFFKGWSFNIHAEIFVAWENSQNLVTLPLLSLPNDVWEMSSRIPYWWRVTTQILVVLVIIFWLNQISQICVVTCHQCGISAFISETSFCRKSVVVSPNVGCFLKLKYLWSITQSSDLVNFSLFTL